MAKRSTSRKKSTGNLRVKKDDAAESRTRAQQAAVLSSPWWKRDWFLGLLLAIATILAYHPAWNGALLWDDDGHLTKPGLRSLGGLGRIWFKLGATQQYYPLTFSVFWIEHKLWGDATFGYHLVNLGLHVSSAFLLLKILRRLEIPGAFLASALFALHPVQVESVAWISELKNTLSGTLYLGSALVYLKFDETRKNAPYVIALALFVLALAAKTVVATLPAALLLLFWWKRGKLSGKRDVLPLVPFFFVGIVGGLFTAWVEQKFFVMPEGSEFNLSPVGRFLLAGRVFWFYLGKFFWPAKLTFIYPHWDVSDQIWWQYLFPVAAAALIVGLALLHRRGTLVGVLFFAGTLFPALGFFNVYPFRYSYVADHFQYLAAIGPMVLFAAGLTMTVGYLGEREFWLRPLGTGILLVILGILTWRQAETYSDMETLWRKTLAQNPNCWLAHNNLGIILEQSGRMSEAMEQYRETLRLKPDYAEGNNNMGNIMEKAGRPNEAIEYYRESLKTHPNYAEAHNNFGNVLKENGKLSEAMEQYKQALQFKPDYAEAHFDLGVLLQQRGQFSDAIGQFSEALKSKPDYVEAYDNLGNALQQIARFPEAIEQYQRALKINDRDAEVHSDLGGALQQTGRLAEAMEQYQLALQINPDYADAHYNLALVLEEVGRRAEAVGQFQQVLRIEPGNKDAQKNLLRLQDSSPSPPSQK
jgi:tetratricopeptide (TPR) repeat protein